VVFGSGLTADTSLPVTRAIDLLRSMGYHELVSSEHGYSECSRDKYEPRHAHIHRAIRAIGCDCRIHAIHPHLAKGGIIDTRHELQKKRGFGLFEITRALADKYVPYADGRANGKGRIPCALRSCGGMWRTQVSQVYPASVPVEVVNRQHRRVAQR